ncbi:MAG: S1 RNA-binding domain-containing protein [Candidatus Falkowbacteria bacterium]|nr:S1 RNA-binding domain-containing protein [Candidatus Falkowbacteria bacterium]
MRDPWQEASAKYQAGQVVKGTILKVNPFGLFVKLDEEIHGLAHISQIGLAAKDKITDLFQSGEVRDFEIVNISPSEHRLGLKLAGEEKSEAAPKKEKVSKKKAEKEEVAEEVTSEETEA